MVDIVRFSEVELAWSLSQSELDISIAAMKTVASKLSDAELSSKIGCDRKKLASLIGYLELVKWRAYGSEELDNSLAPYIKIPQ
ncbi:hypothetical protein [Marinomonas sp. TW1]|uniref:hypothetical protein n=1 Tax=Marinomonas sp. TW1 TaxID=1561203 RepID=UPI0007AF87D5|nr:hypothetical protein [Marinomonas sp. TW1]KZN12190.1 hypothetical protein OA79_17555 [Marinomonas sp. TW1]